DAIGAGASRGHRTLSPEHVPLSGGAPARRASQRVGGSRRRRREAGGLPLIAVLFCRTRLRCFSLSEAMFCFGCLLKKCRSPPFRYFILYISPRVQWSQTRSPASETRRVIRMAKSSGATCPCAAPPERRQARGGRPRPARLDSPAA